MMIGNRYHNRRVIEAGILQQGLMLRKISAAIADEDKRNHLDTVAAIDNLFMSTVQKTSASPELNLANLQRLPRSASRNPA